MINDVGAITGGCRRALARGLHGTAVNCYRSSSRIYLCFLPEFLCGGHASFCSFSGSSNGKTTTKGADMRVTTAYRLTVVAYYTSSLKCKHCSVSSANSPKVDMLSHDFSIEKSLDTGGGSRG